MSLADRFIARIAEYERINGIAPAAPNVGAKAPAEARSAGEGRP